MEENKVSRAVGAFGRAIPALLALCTVLVTFGSFMSLAADKKVWVAGNYSFSDELGGFAIRAIAGKGTRDDPIVIDQELYSASPVTMVIRAHRFLPDAGDLSSSALFLRTNITNAGGQGWIEFQFELQEILGRASIFSDGLSFDQRQEETKLIRSTLFANFSRDFEPYDQLRFINGKVDSGETASFSFALTDFTPRPTFYLVEDPRIPSS